MLRKLRYLIVAVLLTSPGLACAARTFGLVIGINSYAHVPTLDGARDDALDLSSVLNRMGVEDVITLLDQDANKRNVVQAWQTLVSRARPGDVIFMSYAGHGAQAPERNKGEEKDGTDEFWVLPGFDPQNVRETWRETVFDNELNDWFKEASSRGIRVVFVSDSCHAGGMDRAVNGRLRYVDFGKSRILGELLSLMLMDQGTQSPQADDSALPDNVTLLAATSESLPVPEVVIDGRPRGALSWSVARAFEGMADRNRDGMLSRTELEDYVLSTVRMRSESLQTPVFTPLVARVGQEPVIALRPDASIQVASQPSGQGAQRPIPMARDLGFEPVLIVSLKGTDIQPENTVKGRYSYEWDAARGVFKTPNGEVAGEHITPYTVNDVVSKFILLDFLHAVARAKPGKTSISPEKSLYREGERIKYDSLRGTHPNMLVFNLANTGEVQFLDMITNGEPTKKTLLKEMQVVSPFGADHLVTISTSASVDYIGNSMAKGISPKELLRLLSSRIDGTDVEVSIVPLYTRANNPKP